MYTATETFSEHSGEGWHPWGEHPLACLESSGHFLEGSPIRGLVGKVPENV